MCGAFPAWHLTPRPVQYHLIDEKHQQAPIYMLAWKHSSFIAHPKHVISLETLKWYQSVNDQAANTWWLKGN
jgi:hypothetical protein